MDSVNQSWLLSAAEATSGTVVGAQGTGKCPVCGKKEKFRFSIGRDDHLKVSCHSASCKERSEGHDQSWLHEVADKLAAAGVPRTALAGRAAVAAPSGPSGATATPGGRPAPPAPTQDDVDAWLGRAYWWEPELYAALGEARGVSTEVLLDAEVGWDAGRSEHRDRRYSFPIRHVWTGQLLDVDHYGLAPRRGPKMNHQTGGTTHFYGPGGVNTTEPVFVCEGHVDALVARTHGLNAASVTGGAESLPPADEFAAFAGADVVIVFDCDDAGRRGAKKLAQAFAIHTEPASVKILDLTTGGMPADDKACKDVSDWFNVLHKTKDELLALAAAASSQEDAAKAATDVLWLSNVDQKPLSWLWSGRLPFGKITILEGDPGLGKSTIWCDMVARVTTGERFPGDDLDNALGRALVVAAEDDLGDTIVPRLKAAGASLERVATFPLSRGDDGHLIPMSLFERRQWQAALKAAGYTDGDAPRFYDLRHTFATLHAEAGTPPHVLMYLLGHSNIKTTMNVYVHGGHGDPTTRATVERIYAGEAAGLTR